VTRLGADATATTIAELKALGVTVVSRYVSDFPAKNLTPAEARRISAAGIDLVTNWENDVNDWAGGRPQGVAYATRALAQHKACGGPTGASEPWGIYFSVDERVDPNSVTLHDYFRGVNSVLGVAHTGVYGQTSVLRVLRSLGLVGCGERGGTWRSMSTFGLPEGLGSPGEFDVEQTGQFNAQYDRDVVNSVRFGQWRIGAPAVVPSSAKEIDMILQNITGSSEVWALSGSLYWHVADPSTLQSYRDAGVAQATVSAVEHAVILARSAARDTVAVSLTLSDAQVAALGAAIAAGVKMPTTLTLTGTETVTETGSLK
jgi:hypothetical protein